jgi:hypothetical protein
MKTTHLLAILGMATLILISGCQQATDTKAATPPDINTAPAATQTKWANASAAITAGSVAMNNGTAMSPTYMTTDLTTHVTSINYPNDANGLALTGTVTPGTTSSTTSLTLTITNATDTVTGTKVTGTTTLVSTSDNTTHVENSTVTSNFVATFSDNTQSTMVLKASATVDATGKSTTTGTVTIDGVTYTITQ